MPQLTLVYTRGLVGLIIWSFGPMGKMQKFRFEYGASRGGLGGVCSVPMDRFFSLSSHLSIPWSVCLKPLPLPRISVLQYFVLDYRHVNTW